MKIVLVSPVNPRDTDYLRDSRPNAFLAGLKLKYWIEKNTRHEVSLVHSDVEDPYAIDYNNYDFVGITSYYPTKANDMALGSWIKKHYPHIRLIYGGINPTMEPEAYMEDGDADYVVKGEGERPLTYILNAITRQMIPDIVGGGKTTRKEWEDAIYRMPYEVVPWQKIWEFNRDMGMRDAVRLVTQAGCKRGCIFCCVPNYIDKPRFLRTEWLANLCDRVAEFMPVGSILILNGDDELYGKARDRFFELHESGYKFPRPVLLQTEANRINDEIAKALRELGVFMVSLGLESFSEIILSEFQKKASVDDNEAALETLLRHNITPLGNIIINGVSDNQVGANLTRAKMRYWKKRGAKFAVNERVIPLPGTKLSLQRQ